VILVRLRLKLKLKLRLPWATTTLLFVVHQEVPHVAVPMLRVGLPGRRANEGRAKRKKPAAAHGSARRGLGRQGARGV